MILDPGPFVQDPCILYDGVLCMSPAAFRPAAHVHHNIIQPSSPTYMQNKSPPPIRGGTPAQAPAIFSTDHLCIHLFLGSAHAADPFFVKTCHFVCAGCGENASFSVILSSLSGLGCLGCSGAEWLIPRPHSITISYNPQAQPTCKTNHHLLSVGVPQLTPRQLSSQIICIFTYIYIYIPDQ